MRTRRRRLTSAAAVAATTAGLLTGVAFAAAPAAFAATSNPNPSAGSRKGATRLPFSISGTSSLSVDVGTGNALFTDQLLTLPGVRNDVPVTLSYNSSVFGTSTPSAVTNSNGSGWAISGFDERMVTNADNSVTFYGPDGLTGVFTQSGSGYTAPSQFQATLSGSKSAGYTLTNHASQEKLTFNSSGRLTKDTDRDGNATTYSYDSNGYPSMVQSSRGPSAVQQLAITTSGGRITKLTQSGVGSVTRSVTIGYSSNAHLASITDTAGGVTSFDSNPEGGSAGGSDTGQVVHIKSPGKSSTYLTFASGGQVASVSQSNPPIDGGAGEAVTRLTYPSSTQTLEADPTTSQSQAVSAVAHTTYTIGSGNLVTKATDPDGNTRSDTYTSLGQIQTATNAAGGTTTNTYGANGGESLTKSAAPGGASDSASYGNSGSNAYLPSSTTDDASNATQYTYDSNGNQTGTTQGASGQQAKVTYNNDGTPSTSASPGAASGVNTNYAYNSAHDLTSYTPPSNGSLGARSYTYDAFDRLQTATDGAGHTITYSYDNADRITQVSYSDGTATVSYVYNATGQVTQRTDASGVTTYTYDDLGHLLSVHSSANGNTVSYTYDLAGDLATVTDGNGTTTYHYDAAHELTSMNYPQTGKTELAVFANNSDGQRTDVWLQSNADHTVWAAHEQFTYDNSNRISTVKGENGPATNPTTVENETLCYAATVSPQNCSSGTAAEDRSNVQSTYESVSGETNTYTYDDHDRLTKDAVTGGSNPRTYTYSYDAAGNRTSSQVTGNNPSTQNLSFNNDNQITNSGYTYDGAGNLTASPVRTATFNAAGQQTSATVSRQKATYTYAGTNADELTSEYVPAQSKTYTYTYGRPDNNGLPEVDSVNVSGLGTGYIISDPSGQPVILSTSTGNSLLYLYDGIHNPIGLSTSFQTTAKAVQYDPYGTATTTNTSGFSTSYEDPTTFGEGLIDQATNEVKFGQRYYAPSIGSWTQQDALNAPLDPSNANRYEYAADNPINGFDPTGQNLFSDIASDVVSATVAVGTGLVCEAGVGESGVGAVGCGYAAYAAGEGTHKALDYIGHEDAAG